MAKYVPGHIPGVEPRTARLIQQLYEMNNQLSDEVGKLRASMPPVGAKKENPQKGMLFIPGNINDGFARVSPDGVIVSYTNPVQQGGVTPLLCMAGDQDVQVNVDTPLYQVMIPGDSMKVGEMISFQFGGFIIGTPLVSGTVTIRVGASTLVSVTYTISVTQFHFKGIFGPQNTPNWDSATVVPMGFEVSAVANAAPTIASARGELAVDWSIDNLFTVSGSVNGTAPAATVVEAINVIKYSTL